MIRVRFSSDNVAVTLQVTGHANYAEEGKDIVCAAISTLMNTLAASVEKFDCPQGINLEKGDAFVSASPTTNEEAVLLGATFGTILNGMQAVALEYPGYVKIHKDIPKGILNKSKRRS